MTERRVDGVAGAAALTLCGTVDMRPTTPPLARAYAPGAAGQIHYYDSLGEGPSVLLIHQSPTSAMDFCAVFPRLISGGFRVIALDLPGMGLSDAPAAPPRLPDFAAAALSVLDHAGVDAAHLVGHHTGAAVAVFAARNWPARVMRVALYGVPAAPPEAMAALWARIVPSERAGGLFTPRDDGDHLASLYRRLAGPYGPAVANRMVLSRLLCGPTLWFGHNAALTWDMRPDLKADRHPLCLITHPGEMLHEYTLAARDLRPDARLAVLDVDTALAIDAAPDLWSAAVTGFLQGEDA